MASGGLLPQEATGLSTGLPWTSTPSPELFRGLRDRGYAALGIRARRPWRAVQLGGREAQGEGSLGADSP